MKKQTKYFAVLSAAAIMALTPAFSGLDHTGRVLAASYGWTEENGQLAYYDEDGYLTTDSWRKNGDDWYYLDEEGSIARNQKIDDYYVGEDGKMVKNTWVELQNEDEMDSPETPASYWYYFDKNGKSVISKWIKLNENWYYFNESGHMATGKTVIDGAVYYLGGETDGRMKTGWVKLEENASSPGASESWHYFNSDGRMVENQYDKKIGDDYYTFIDGKMQTFPQTATPPPPPLRIISIMERTATENVPRDGGSWKGSRGSIRQTRPLPSILKKAAHITPPEKETSFLRSREKNMRSTSWVKCRLAARS